MNEPRLTVVIESFAVGGDGVAHHEWQGQNRAVFVPQVAPGEEVEVSLDASVSPMRGTLESVRRPSPFRREPPCAQAVQCGGCPWMFLDEQGQQRAREELLRSTVLRALGAEAPAEVLLHEAPWRERYRERARLAFSLRGRAQVGYRRPRSRQVLPVEECLVLAPPLEGVLGPLRGWLGKSRGEGEVSLALGAGGKPVLALEWARGEPDAGLFGALEKAVQRGEIAGASVRSEGARAPAVVGDPTAWSRGADGAPLETPDFAQAHPGVVEQIGAHLRRLVGTARGSVVELFAGAGTFTVALAPGNPRYTAEESSPASCGAARRNLAGRGLSWVKVVEARAEEWAVPPRTELVLLDPPRGGARQTCEALASSQVQELLYVSCDPVTLSRDLGVLIGAGWRVRSLHGFDLFPQTSHLEVVAHLARG
ncbi:MAG: class I SAM-dependent RNA methyltransferase [Polyangiaceae bacterium]|nr:class I SAM-dependent RNA methyltransferase [Polyangiaceae bacterium]